MSKKKSIFIVFSFVTFILTAGVFLYNAVAVNAKANNEKAQQLLSDEYEFDLTRLVVVRKNTDKPEIIVLEDIQEEEGYVSSKLLREKNNDFSKNQKRLEKLESKLVELLNDKSIKHVQPDYLYTNGVWSRDSLLDTPDDFDMTPLPATGNHWYYEKSNLRSLWYEQDCFNGGVGCGGSSDVVVAVIDTGLAFQDYNDSAWIDVNDTPYDFDPAPDMFVSGSINLWTNDSGEPPEIANNDLDDDGNGFIDDYHGVNMDNYFYCQTWGCSTEESGETGHPDDDGGHGTFVTGLIASLTGNGTGSVSPAANVQIMTIKANYSKTPSFGSSRLVESINYAVENGAHIINLSLAGSSYDYLLEQAINNAHDEGVLVIASSGNSYSSVWYPARYENVIAVGAVNSNNTRSNYSSYGPELDLVAYVGSGSGEGITTYQQSYECFFAPDVNCYFSNDPARYTSFKNSYAQGTSFASPQVAAAAAIILGNNMGMSPNNLKLGLISSTNDINAEGYDEQTGHGVLDYSKTLDFDISGSNKTAFYTAYRDQAPTYKSWIMIGNPSLTETLYTSVHHQGTNGEIKYVSVSPNTRESVKFSGATGGPVKIVGDSSFYTTIKSEVNSGPDETKGFNLSELSSKYYFPAYRNEGSIYRAWILIGNPNNSPVEVEVVHSGINGGTVTQTIPANDRTTISFAEASGGPVTVRSTNDTSLIYTTIKSEVNGLPDESEGISINNLATKYYFPAYRHQPGTYRAWIIVGNPNIEATEVEVEHFGTNGGTQVSTIGPGERETFVFNGASGGPVTVSSTNGTSLVYATIKSEVNGGPDETAGISLTEMDSKYYLPAYRDEAPQYKAWIIVGNPQLTSVNVNVEHLGDGGGSQNVEIAGGQRYTFKFSGASGGPVIITSTGGDVYASVKSEVNGYPDETFAIPNKNL